MSLISHVSAFNYGAMDPNMMMMMMPDNTSDLEEDEEVIDAYQTYFIKSNFLKPTFKNGNRFYQDDETPSGYYEYTIYNDLMMDQLAGILAKQDVFHLREIIQQGLDSEKESEDQ
ncbi:hypothetical protein HOH87_03085 [bacterium]|nr:hypothetical protein [bacterium]